MVYPQFKDAFANGFPVSQTAGPQPGNPRPDPGASLGITQSNEPFLEWTRPVCANVLKDFPGDCIHHMPLSFGNHFLLLAGFPSSPALLTKISIS